MAKANGKRAHKSESAAPAISRITVAGFKSIGPERSIEIRPLTLLAGANSSGKSSMMQPLLLLKQTLEAPYDPGPLLLNGPNVKFTSADQLLARIGKAPAAGSFHLGLQTVDGHSFKINFRKEHGTGFAIEQMSVGDPPNEFVIWPGMSATDIASLKMRLVNLASMVEQPVDESEAALWEVKRYRCFLGLSRSLKNGAQANFARNSSVLPLTSTTVGAIGNTSGAAVYAMIQLAAGISPAVEGLIHLPGVRGSPERVYPVAAVGPAFIGSFEKYTASIISNWAAQKQTDVLAALDANLGKLVLAGGVSAVPINAAQFELYVGKLPNIPPKRPEERVNIADVGIGVSQVLPVVTALLAAKPGQLVYIEQPEIHLHPRAQVAMARLLADAANRGVRVVAETHSSLVLLGVQSLVAEGALAPENVALHWFQRNEKTGATDITTADLDRTGAYGDWPEDFADIRLKADLRYIEAAHEHLKNEANGKESPAQARH